MHSPSCTGLFPEDHHGVISHVILTSQSQVGSSGKDPSKGWLAASAHHFAFSSYLPVSLAALAFFPKNIMMSYHVICHHDVLWEKDQCS